MKGVCGYFHASWKFIYNHVQAHAPDDKRPTPWFWVVLALMTDFVEDSDVFFRIVQGRETTITQQRAALDQFESAMLHNFNAEKIAPAEVAQKIDSGESLAVSERVCNNGFHRTMAHSRMRSFLLGDLNASPTEIFESMNEEDQDILVCSLAESITNMIVSISLVEPERDSDNEACRALPTLTPKTFVDMRNPDFKELVRVHKDRLLVTKDEQFLEDLQNERKQLARDYANEPALRRQIDKVANDWSLVEAWRCCKDRVPSLLEFVGGLAAVFPGTSTVESDFSVVNCEKNDKRALLTDFSLDAILHSKQHGEIQACFQAITG